MPTLEVSASRWYFSQTPPTFEYAFSPGWFETHRTAFIPVTIHGQGWAHQNLVLCQLLAGNMAVQCMHFEPHGRCGPMAKTDWIERHTREALGLLCQRKNSSRPLDLLYHPVSQICPRIGSQITQANTFRHMDKDFVLGLCVMHCLNIVKMTLRMMKAKPGVVITPVEFQQIIKSSSESIIPDLLQRTHSLMALGGYRNDRLHDKAMKRMTNSEKRAFLQKHRVALKPGKYHEARGGMIGDLFDWYDRPLEGHIR